MLRCININKYGTAASMESLAAPGAVWLGTNEAAVLYGIMDILTPNPNSGG
jgi:hypothetical protein